MTTTTLIRTRRRTRRPAPVVAPAPALADRAAAALAAHEPLMVAVADWGRGWWVVDASPDAVTVRRHGETLQVPWSSVELDG